MSGARDVYRKARTSKENKAGSVVGFLDALNQVNYSSWFIFLGIKGVLRDTFFAFERYFFFGSFVLNAVGAIFYLYSYIHAANRNVLKLSNLAIRGFSIALTLLLTFGAALVSPTIFMAARIISLVLNPIQFLTRFIYFTYKYVAEDRPSFKAFYKSKIFENGFGTLISTFIIAGIVLLYTVAALPINLMLALSVLGPVIVLAVQAFRLFSFLRGDTDKAVSAARKTNDDAPDSASSLGNTTARLSVELRDRNLLGESKFNLSMLRKGLQAQFLPKKGIANKLDFHRHSLPKAVDISELRSEVTLLKQRILRQMQPPSDKTATLIAFFQKGFNAMQLAKREDKLAAIEFLEIMMQNFGNIPRASIHNPVIIQQKAFFYRNIDDLFNQVQQHVLDTWPDAFQSIFTNISHTETCFQTLCMLLNEKFSPTPKSVASPAQQRKS